jgi:diguanylate cyclase (GGDEF)-like protein/PAS domain S-box-containing protein
MMGECDGGADAAIAARSEDRELHREHQLSAMVNGAAAPLVLVDVPGRVVRLNQACADLVATSPDTVLGRPVWEALPFVDDSEFGAQQWHAVAAGTVPALCGEQLSTDGSGNRHRIAWSYRLIAADGAGPSYVVGTGVDVTRERLAEVHWRHRSAKTDPLTGLANRAAFDDAIAHFAQARSGLGCGVLVCGFDGIKRVIYDHGQAAGDQLLVDIAERLRAAVRGNDLVARFDDDEFAILLPAVGLLPMRALATRVESIVRRPIRLETGLVTIDLSVGLVSVGPGDDVAAALDEAGAAMKAMKYWRAAWRRAAPPNHATTVRRV